MCVCGDFNARSTLWGSPKVDTRGKSIENILQKSNLVVLNTGAPTRIYKNGCSHIDLAFSSPRYANTANWEVFNSTCGSDHNLIKIEFQTFSDCEQISRPKWIFNKADWPKFSFLCDTNLADVNFEEDLESLSKNITKAISEAANDSIPKSSGLIKKRHAKFWNEKCATAVKERDSAKRALKINSSDNQFIEYKRLKAVANKTIKSEKRKSWRTYCSSLSHRTKLSNIWRVIKNMNNSHKGESIPVLDTSTGTAKTNRDKANVFGKHYANISSTSNYTKKFRKHKKGFEEENENVFCVRENNTSVLNVPFKMSEFKKALKKCKNTTPGKDQICYEMFKHMSIIGKECVLKFFNRIWEKGFMPSTWRHALIIPILKPNKIKNEPGSYRPIALTSNFCKLMERMIVARLNWYMEKHNLFNIFQSGFRKSRNTVDQLLRLSDDIIKSLANKSCVLGVFLDFEKAYDMVWRKGVLYKLNQLGLDGNIFNWINAFLQDRSIQVRIGTTLSDNFTVENGLPQGSVLSPILFLIAINDLAPENVKYSLFADDTAIWKTGKNIKHIQKQIQRALDEIQDWCNRWGFKISIAKTSFVLFHKGKGKVVHLSLNGQPLNKAKNVKFLGMVLDQALTWKDHVEYLVEKCQKRINILKLLTGSKWGADKETMVILYKTLIRSMLDYGSVIYHSASKTTMQKLDVIQSQSLRLCCGALKCTPVGALEVECGVSPLELRRNFQAQKSFIKYRYLSGNPAQECLDDCYQLHYGKYNEHFKPLKLKVEDTIKDLPEAFVNQISDTIPPWEYDHPLYDTELHTILSKTTDNPHFMLSASLENMANWSTSLHIYTDGSKCNIKCACAFYVPSIKFSKMIRLPDNTSIFIAEMVAILEALQFILLKPPISCVIFSDSLSSIQSLDSGTETSAIHQEIRYCIYQLWCQGVPVTISWIPSHVGVQGNEVVDKLAKKALSHDYIDYPILKDISELNKTLENNLIKQWQALWEANTKGRFYYKIQPSVSNVVKFSDPNKTKQTAITRLRFGKCLLGDVLFMLGKRNDNLCEYCHTKEDVRHFLIDCAEYQELHIQINDKVLMAGKIPSVETLLGDSRWYNDVWNFVLESHKSL